MATTVFTLPILVFGGPLVGETPQAGLAGVLFAIAARMIDATAMSRLWRASSESRLLLVITFVSTLVLPIEWAILLGSGAGLVLHLARTSAPRIRLLRPEGERLVPVAADAQPESVVVEVSGDLHYAAVPPFLAEAERLVPSSARRVVLDLSHTHQIRFAALLAFENLAAQVEARGGILCLAGADAATQMLLTRSGSTLHAVPAEVEPGLSVRLCLASMPTPGGGDDGRS